MANRKAMELRALETEQLEDRLHEAQQDLIGLRFGLATRQTENTARLASAKRDIARIKTLLHERSEEE